MNATLTAEHKNKDLPARLPALFAAYTVVGFDPAEQRTADPVTLRLYASREARPDLIGLEVFGHG